MGQHIIILLSIHVRYGYGQSGFVQVIIKISQSKYDTIQSISIHNIVEHQKYQQSGLV